MLRRTRWLPAAAGPGVIAGLTGAVLIDGYLIVTEVFLTHAVGLATLYQFVASGALGSAAYREPGSAYVGILLHVLISLAWGIGYAFVAAGTPQVRARPLISGIAFGLIVMLAMQLVEVAADIYRLPTTLSLLNAVIAHTVFFGLPIAYIVTKRLG